jgi:hypothetical protein
VATTRPSAAGKSRRSPPDKTKISPAVAETVKVLPKVILDRAAVRLAERYAAEIDAAADREPCAECDQRRPDEALAKYGPLLLAVLAALGATPASRAAAVKGGSPNVSGPTALDRLRADRAARPR